MPELPEVETTKRGIEPHICHQTITQVCIRNANLRWPVEPNIQSKLLKSQIQSLSRRGKYLLIHFNHGTALWHLGMSGSLRIVSDHTPLKKHDHIDWTFANGAILRFNDPRRFGALVWTEEPIGEHPLLSHLGPEPLSDAFDADYLFNASRCSKQHLKPWLMNASTVVGVGNIYANEALFSAALHPLKQVSTLSKPQCQRLCHEIKNVLNQAIQQGGTTLRDFVGGDGKPGYFAQKLMVYGKGGLPCPNCHKPLTEKAIGQRSSVYCVACQKR